MLRPTLSRGQSRPGHATTGIVVCLAFLTLLLSACGPGAPSTIPQATRNKGTLDQQINTARNMGVPAGLLQPIIDQERTLSHTGSPAVTIFSNQAATNYYANLARQYKTLTDQITTLEGQATLVSAKLKQFNTTIATMKLYGMSTTAVQQKLTTTQTAISNVKKLSDYEKFPTQIANEISALSTPILEGKAKYLVQQFHQQVTSWGNTHQYHDSYDGQSYNLDYEYDQQGIGSNPDTALSTAQTPADYQNVINMVQGYMANLQAMEADAKATTPANQPHASDLSLMKYYKITSQYVIVISLVEQTLRVYQNGKVIKQFDVTTGQYAKPSLPGLWDVDERLSPTEFISDEPESSPYWYPPTPINYAMGYLSSEGYFLHDSWWRANYGVGTNFPHYDTGGDELFAGNGSHGCINIEESNAQWLYNSSASAVGTPIIIY